jgi:uridine kinase
MGEFEENPVLFSIYQEYKNWGKILRVASVGRLDELIRQGGIQDFILIAEAFQDKKIAEIADRICAMKDQVRVVLIAGPSSSGKTTFSKKLMIQLRVVGRNPVTISLDDYYKSNEKTPRDLEGKPDFESLDALDVELLNNTLVRLLKAEEVEVPIFDFHIGSRKQKGRKLRLPDRAILILEGIHGLNDDLTPSVPRGAKYKVYVSALTPSLIWMTITGSLLQTTASSAGLYGTASSAVTLLYRRYRCGPRCGVAKTGTYFPSKTTPIPLSIQLWTTNLRF